MVLSMASMNQLSRVSMGGGGYHRWTLVQSQDKREIFPFILTCRFLCFLYFAKTSVLPYSLYFLSHLNLIIISFLWSILIYYLHYLTQNKFEWCLHIRKLDNPYFRTFSRASEENVMKPLRNSKETRKTL